MTREHKVGTILSFVLGVAAGAVTALLLAPKSGTELRGDIAEGVSDGVNQVRSSGQRPNTSSTKVRELSKSPRRGRCRCRASRLRPGEECVRAAKKTGNLPIAA